MIAELLAPAGLVALIPILAGVGLAFLRNPLLAGWIGIASASSAFVLACLLPGHPHVGRLLLVDPLSAHLALLTSFVGLTSAWFSRGYVARSVEAGVLDAFAARQCHAALQMLLGFTLLAMLANNLGVLWCAIEAATIVGVIAVALSRTARAAGAAWRYLLIVGVGLALALFGTFILYLAALPVLGPGPAAMSWTELARAAPRCAAPLLNLAFVFLLVGYGTKAALVPLHGWIPDACAEGLTPISAVLSGSVLNAALLGLIRLRGVVAANAAAVDPGPPIMALALASVLLASFSLWRRRDIKRFFAFSTIQQSGLAAFAIGLGSRGALFAGLLHITVHTLGKSAVFQCVGRACQVRASQTFAGLGGLFHGQRALAVTLAGGMVALIGLPPFGLFSSQVLILTETLHAFPLLALPLGLGLVVGAWAIAARLIGLMGAPAMPDAGSDAGPAVALADLAPACMHLGLIVLLGLAMPGVVLDWLRAAAAVP